MNKIGKKKKKAQPESEKQLVNWNTSLNSKSTPKTKKKNVIVF